MPYALEVGMDLHKMFSVFATMTPDGQVLSYDKVSNNIGLFDEYFKRLPAQPVRVTVESTRGVNWVIDYFENRHVDLVVSNPFMNRAIANVRCKSDRYDARTLADLTRSNLIARCYVPPRHVRELRELIIHRLKLVRISTMLKNKVHTILSHYNYLTPLSDTFGPSGREWLSKQQFSELHSRVVTESLDLLNELLPRIQALEKTIVEKVHEHKYFRNLLTIPGIGPLNAAILISRVDTIDRFNRNVDKFVKYAGLAINTRSSADHIHLGHLNKRSDKMLRTAFIDAALVAMKKDPGLCQFHDYLLSCKGKGIARVAVARKLARSAFFVMLTGKPYKFRMIQQKYMKPS
jgi:transposase